VLAALNAKAYRALVGRWLAVNKPNKHSNVEIPS